MSRTRWWVIVGLLCAVAAGVQAVWLVVLLELDLQVPAFVIVLLAFFPGSMGWLMPVGFAWLWKDEIEGRGTHTEAS